LTILNPRMHAFSSFRDYYAVAVRSCTALPAQATSDRPLMSLN
jgi:hypothetical protein